MKRSPSSNSCSSSASSCVVHSNLQIDKKPKTKRVRSSKKKKNLDDPDGTNNAAAAVSRRSSIYRGVTRHRWTGRFEAHLWDKSTWNSIQNKKGRQRAYDNEEAAAHTYDLAALKYWGVGTTLNFPIDTYTKEVEEMEKLTKEEYLASLRRRSSGFSRGVSKYRGVARHHHNGKWEARIGRVFGNKYLYLGTYNDHNQPLQQQNPNFSTQEDEGEEEEDKQLILVQPQLPPNLCHDLPTPNSIDSSEMEHDHPWDLCLDTSVFNPLSVPDLIPLEKAGDLPPEYMFDSDYKSFEDDIDFMMFDVPTSHETTSDYFNPDSLFEITAGGFDMEADSFMGFMGKEEEEDANGHRVSGTSPPPSSSSSTTTT
ncbi:hypothetical protein RHGRI_019764 [Rhododendron griersonianum]|uniref:AP2/ERF domain-containing protein n=1 Tax=Rhododendron griersonianum TaxID=479676 RepID=A0AAV6JDU8_9ERIC|nr:hypothetical protein RHGRI_019764 [Rhododendron griersonianum]